MTRISQIITDLVFTNLVFTKISIITFSYKYILHYI